MNPILFPASKPASTPASTLVSFPSQRGPSSLSPFRLGLPLGHDLAGPSVRATRAPVDIPGVWSVDVRGGAATDAAVPVWSSGLPALDAELPGGGWPRAGMIEWLARELGAVVPRLLASALRASAAPADWVCVLPPNAPAGALGLPCPQGWAAAGLCLARTLFIHPLTEADGAWAAEQALRSRAAQGVLWFSREASTVTLRRLHWAATEAGVPLVAARPWARQADPSPALLRLSLEPLAGQRLRLNLLKRRGPALEQPLMLTVPTLPPALLRAEAEPAASGLVVAVPPTASTLTPSLTPIPATPGGAFTPAVAGATHLAG